MARSRGNRCGWFGSAYVLGMTRTSSRSERSSSKRRGDWLASTICCTSVPDSGWLLVDVAIDRNVSRDVVPTRVVMRPVNHQIVTFELALHFDRLSAMQRDRSRDIGVVLNAQLRARAAHWNGEQKTFVRAAGGLVLPEHPCNDAAFANLY